MIRERGLKVGERASGCHGTTTTPNAICFIGERHIKEDGYGSMLPMGMGWYAASSLGKISE